MSDQPEKKAPARKPRDPAQESNEVTMKLKLPRAVFNALNRSGAKFDLGAREMLEGHAITSARGADIPLNLAAFMDAPKLTPGTEEELPLQPVS